MGTPRSWTPDKVEFLRRKYPGASILDTTAKVNAEFGTDFSGAAVQAAALRHGIGGALRNTWKSGTRKRTWTPEIIKYCKRMYPQVSRPEMIGLLKDKFDLDVSLSSLQRAKHNYDFGRSPSDGRFKPGEVRRGRPPKGVTPPALVPTLFRPGHNLRERPMWSETMYKGGLFMKVPLPDPHSVRPYRWIRKAVYVWVRERGVVPEGHVILQVNGCKTDCSIENLQCVPRRIVANINKRQLDRDSELFQIAAWVEILQDQIRQREQSNG